MQIHDVYTDGDKPQTLFSDAVTREFGTNCAVKTPNGVVLAAVMPLKVDPDKFGLKHFGEIYLKECY